jgi:hypothetical protein
MVSRIVDGIAVAVCRTRRADPTPSEQQNGLIEDAGSQPCRLERATVSLARRQQGADGPSVGQLGALGCWRLTGSTEETAEAHQPALLRHSLSHHHLSSMPQRLREIQATSRDACEPLAHGSRTDVMKACCDSYLGSAMDGSDSAKDVPHVVDLAR